MITQEQALTKARAWLNEGAQEGAERELRSREFDLGWVVWAAPAPLEVDPVTGEVRPPSNLGDATGVVDRETGELSTWPSIPIDAVIAAYQEQQAGR